MIIEKFLNNNMLLVNDNHEEMIVMGKGLRFHYKVGDEIRDEDIEKHMFFKIVQIKMDIFKF